MVIIRVGEGQSPSGKILDRDTKWFQAEFIYDALKYHLETGKKMYISKNNKAYTEFNPDTTTISELFKEKEYDWYKENSERGAFALSQKELDFYYNPERLKTPIW